MTIVEMLAIWQEAGADPEKARTILAGRMPFDWYLAEVRRILRLMQKPRPEIEPKPLKNRAGCDCCRLR